MSDLVKKIIIGVIGSVVTTVLSWYLATHLSSDPKTTDSGMVPRQPSAQTTGDTTSGASSGNARPPATLPTQTRETPPVEGSYPVDQPTGASPGEPGRSEPPVGKTDRTSQHPEKSETVHTGKDVLRADVENARARGDSLMANDTTKRNVKQVRSRADDVFDELENETAKDSLRQNH